MILDSVIALRILYLLVQPFTKWPAYEKGIIDADGNVIDKQSSSDWTMLHRLVCRIKKIISAVPGGKTMIGSAIAAYALVKEGVRHDDLMLEDMFEYQYSLITEQEVTEMNQLMEDAVGVASVGGGVAPDINGDVEPVVKKQAQKRWTKANAAAPGRKLSFKEYVESLHGN